MKTIYRNIPRFVLLLIAVTTTLSVIARNDKKEISRNLNLFNSLYKELQTTYVDTIDAEKSINTAINAMLNEIDPYTVYISEKEQDEFLTISTGEYAGIGAYIMERDGNVYVSEPYENSPAHRAGLKAGDMFLKINNDSVNNWHSSQVSEKLKGQAETDVEVTVKRKYATDSILTFKITRKKIQMPSVPYYTMLPGGVGYIYLTSFTEKAPQEVKDALLEFKKDPQFKSVVLDLRGNGGGLLESAVQIVGCFVPKGTEVLRTRGRNVLNEKIYKTTTSPVDAKMPLAVLIDGGSASSSEIVAGALQDLDRAVIIGSRSYGKGLVQTTRPLPYNGLLKVTISKYYIPSGRLIQAIDYSHRNPDGSVARTPDSLTTVYHTLAGREVRDGGGITPDVKAVDTTQVNRLTYNIVRDNWSFDFATKFASENARITSPQDFEISDSIFNDFKNFIDPEKFEYDKACESVMKVLKETAQREGYMNDETKKQIEILESMLKHDLNRDLDTNRDEISRILANEIISRYYFQKGRIIEELRHDVTLDKAVEILSDLKEYSRILSPAK